ncbi:hypothetical protein BT96DRAFT_832654 [Gymnopus androsaceus JB14]|uniref:Uncharacterized protein n=1 Tax=Gymnopus androsaceus JB14 TaxID=1447944 RepID=A0A6A4GYN6_9AGAR|nr:hypothetical protein BT96DRAFT_832654 [Gymnopus androsaceus JB14]
MEDGADNGNNLLRAEWGRSRAWMHCTAEEVQLVWEEMWRTAAYYKWRSQWWIELKGQQVVEDAALSEGLGAYADRQSALQKGLLASCIGLWKHPLDGEHPETEEEKLSRAELGMVVGVEGVDEYLLEDEDEEDEEGEDMLGEDRDGIRTDMETEPGKDYYKAGDGNGDEPEDLGWA